MLRVGLAQLSVTDDPAANLPVTCELIRRAAAEGAGFVLTPEMTNALSADRAHQAAVFRREADDPTLAALREEAARAGVWLLVGSLGLLAETEGPPFVNRSFLIDPAGGVAGRYDKIHMFDVALSETEVFRESSAYRPGEKAVLAPTPFGKVGLTVCYDVRFPALYRALAQAGAAIMTVPSAFSHLTGPPHWEALLRARAIETGAWVLAPAQTGRHSARSGRPRLSHGHSLIVSPWGEVVVDGGTEPGLFLADIDLDEVASARTRIPSLGHDRVFLPPEATP